MVTMIKEVTYAVVEITTGECASRRCVSAAVEQKIEKPGIAKCTNSTNNISREGESHPKKKTEKRAWAKRE
jgi:hypothetical protein